MDEEKEDFSDNQSENRTIGNSIDSAKQSGKLEFADANGGSKNSDESASNSDSKIQYRPANYRKSTDSDSAGSVEAKSTELVPMQEHNFTEKPKKEEGSEKKLRLGENLVEKGVISEHQLNVALQEKKMSGKMLGNILVELGFITDDVLVSVLSEDSGYEVFDPKNTIVDSEILKYLHKNDATRLLILPLAINEFNELFVAMSDPYDVVTLDKLRNSFPKGITIKPVVASTTDILDAIDVAYGYSNSTREILRELEEEGDKEISMDELTGESSYTHPIVRLVNAIVCDAVKTKCSDIHFEPEENFIRIRNRKDGVLTTSLILHKKHWTPIAQRLKIMSSMNIADKLTPQDGRFGLIVSAREADFRVSCLPTTWGENIVIRVLDRSQSIVPLSKLGFSSENMQKIKQAQSRPEGIIIITGPTGSGKTTSLYSMLNEINNVEVNIQTMEDPVEYPVPMLRQTAVKEGVLEFADGIKALMRQDPDIIFIGEIRDPLTAEMALKAAMTGHQVYTTLHTNDSFGALPRLVDLGLKPGMIAGNIIAVFAQRLARRLCPLCKQAHVATPKECEVMGVDPENPPEIFSAKQGGCESCEGAGYKGRISIAEILLFDEEIDEVIASEGNKSDLMRVAKQNNFKSMKDDGIIKVLEGVTSLEEIAKRVSLNFY